MVRLLFFAFGEVKPFYEVIFQVGNKDDMGTAGENAELAKTILDKFLFRRTVH